MLEPSLALLSELTPAGFFALFWYAFLFEVPRYMVGFVAVILVKPWQDARRFKDTPEGRVSLLIAGHNEADGIEQCVRSLSEQTLQDYEVIVVDDGSSDGMYEIVAKLEREGLIDRSMRLHVRGGKASALNAAARLATGDIFVTIDCDSSYDRTSIEELIRPFADPEVGAVSGNIIVRNETESFITTMQSIEYIIAIGLGRTLMEMFDQLSVVSGAFSAFRRTAWDQVQGKEPGSGEDFELTLRLRDNDWKISFAKRAVCYTDAPTALWNLIRQRLRWERDAIAIRYRKYSKHLNPFARGFKWTEAIHQIDFLFFHIVAAAVFPFYLLFLTFAFGGEGALIALIVSAVGLFVGDILGFIFSLRVLNRWEYMRLIVYLPAYVLFMSFVMRFVRLFSYVDEWIFSRSLQDDFTPEKARIWSSWR